ncbi:hypothetical protein JW835_14250 [bacterium]|nr:hypothetical protein [bacterium]
MNSPQSTFIPEHIAIPKPFYSDATGKPFERCIHCSRYLLDHNTHYMIEKVHKYYPELKTNDTIFEYAICIDCYMELRKSLSDESVQNLESYLNDHVNLIGRRQQLIQTEGLDIDGWIGSCMIKNKAIQACTEYQTICECMGNRMLFTFMPYMICDEAMEEMMELLSDKTLGFFDDFRNRFLGPSPEIGELLKPSRILLI